MAKINDMPEFHSVKVFLTNAVNHSNHQHPTCHLRLNHHLEYVKQHQAITGGRRHV
ncbi:hypothetical protein SG34_028560 [Thalassomonas viridans]|uniref:Uncharacterized protein n=1 Tax=Thalassomonas viridans TaxID=137584 RepID=A0AAE9Z229_9GAMM|nr:hypothetical protein [Thalassomonas viridans]WDE05200.1 hypothetical protein SG34_028560 [Thalassomonas viridans]